MLIDDDGGDGGDDGIMGHHLGTKKHFFFSKYIPP